eukprot:365480-Chlamydomonas_euryale.AAC.12
MLMPRRRSIGFMPAATDLTPSLSTARVSTVAVVVPAAVRTRGAVHCQGTGQVALKPSALRHSRMHAWTMQSNGQAHMNVHVHAWTRACVHACTMCVNVHV